MVGGLMVAGSAADQDDAVAQALDCGINYFDTAPFYGGGQSEANLGRALATHRNRAIVGTKIRIEPAMRDDAAQMQHIDEVITRSAEDSLRRLGVECLDLLQLHNPVGPQTVGSALTPEAVQELVMPAFQGLVAAGKVRFIGMSALGLAPQIARVIAQGGFDTAQVAYSLLNPSADCALPPGAASEDYGQLLDGVRSASMGVIGIRVLAGGSLSGTALRHPVAMKSVIPLGKGIGSGKDYEQDIACAHRFDFLLEEGLARGMASAALRYGFSNPSMHTMAIGFSSREQIEDAARAMVDGAFDGATLRRIAAVQTEIGVAA